MVTEIYFVRHSKYDRRMINTKNETILLTKDGIRYAKRKLNIPELKNIDVLYSSEFLRAKLTAKVISEYNGNINVNTTKLINERNKGDTSNVQSSFWNTQLIDEDAKTPNGESRKEVTKRMLNFINDVLDKYPNKKVVAVSHAVAITYVLMNYCKLVGFDYRSKYRCLQYNNKTIIDGIIDFCSVIRLTFDENKKLQNIDTII